MNRKLLLVGLVLGTGLTLSLQSSFTTEKVEKYTHKINGSGPPSGRTGAPGESTCTACHSGSVLDGSSENNFEITKNGSPVLDYIPGETYDISVSMTSNPAKKGFQITALDDSNDGAGDFNAMSSNGVSKQSSSGRVYVNQNGQGNTSSTSSWDFEWVAPSDDQGAVTFYLSTNLANGSCTGGDKIYNSTHDLGSSASISEKTEVFENFIAAYNAETRLVYLSYNSSMSGESTINVTDMTGKSMFQTRLTDSKIGFNKKAVRMPSFLANGMYLVNYFIDNQVTSATVIVN